MIHLAELLKVRELTVDTMQYKDFATKEEELKVMRFYQNDLNSAKLLINVTHDKVVTDFSTATKVQIAFLKPDGERVFQEVQNVNQMQGKYYVVLSTQTLIAYGNVIAQLRLTFPNNKVIETCKFVFAVDESIMSDEAVASTNEFPVIQKAIEAGEKLEGVDINEIIAAGAKAEGAVKKTGDTMTGNLTLDKSPASSSSWRNFAWSIDGTEAFRWGLNGSNNFMLWDAKNNVIPIEYRPATQELRLGGTGTTTIVRDSNVVKKSEIYSGFTDSLGKSKVINDVDLNTLIDSGQYTGQRLGNCPEGNTGFFYVEVIRYNSDNFSLQKATNFLSGASFLRVKNNGIWGGWIQSADTTNMKLDISAPNGDATLSIKAGEDFLAKALEAGRGFRTVYVPGSALNGPPGGKPFRGVVNMQGTAYGYVIGCTSDDKYWGLYFNNTPTPKWVCLSGNEKDGKATLTLTADATPSSGTAVQVATRRGNTVTVMMDVIRNADSTNPVMATLPEGMRPTDTINYTGFATDGTPSRIMFRFNGEIHIADNTSKGKRFMIAFTYVVD
ncbi:BppU family phage baseplate upper protein [Bacillus sp. BC08]